MRPKSLVLLFLALGCGLVASIGISQVMDKNRQSDGGVETEAIYVAKVDINLGDPIKAEMVSLEEWPKDRIPSGVVRELTDVEDRRPRAKIFAGEPILDGKLLNSGENDDPTETIPQGFRVLPISVKADTGMAGLINPGDRVDIQWFVPRNLSLRIEKTTTKTILHNIRVFAVDQTVRRMADGEEVPTLAKTVSLLVTPKQANMIRLADKVGEISLVARHPDDAGSEDSSPVSFKDLLSGRETSSREEEQGQPEEPKETGPGFFGALMEGIKANAAAKSAARAVIPTVPVKPPWRMEVIIGDQVEVMTFSPTDGKPLSDGMDGQFEFTSTGNDSAIAPQTTLPPDVGDGLDVDDPNLGGDLDDFPIDLEEEN